MGRDNKNKKHSVFKNVMVSLGCAVFAGAYAFGGCCLVRSFAEYREESAAAAWLDHKIPYADEQPAAAQDTPPAAPSAAPSDNILQEPRFRGGGNPAEAEAGEKAGSKDAGNAESAGADGETIEVSHVQVVQQAELSTVVVADVTAVVKAAMPCVVSVTNEYTAYDYWYDEEYDEEVHGSGIIVSQNDEEILIVTNYHVIEGNESLYVQFIDDAEAAAYVKGASSENDLAIISVFLEDMSEDTLESVAIAALGDSDSLQVGEPAIAIGNSLGYGQSVTTGVISALNRDIFADDPDINQGYLIQTDAAINPGNSGGALLNASGEVIGINSSKIADYVIEGMGYAIPISTAKPIMDDLMRLETRRKVPEDRRAFLGISGTDVTEDANARYEMPEGAYVSDVLKNTAAEKAGILKGDIITYIDRERVSRMSQLQDILQYYEAGTEIEVTLMRRTGGEYKEMTLTVTLGHK